ncbi:MAG: flagellar export protein FliJ [Gammaproteobacteria bacterium]|nr:flagellar export protein FliJ [Gammaproteobacteria bacterium]
MKRSKRLEQISKITKTQEDDMAKALAECQRRFQAHQKQLDDLQLYFQQYSAQIVQESSGGLNISRYQNMQAFLGNLTKAIEQQKRVVEQVRREYEHKRKLWMNKHNRNKAIDAVSQHHRQQEDAQDEKKLQRDIDDRSSRQRGGKD